MHGLIVVELISNQNNKMVALVRINAVERLGSIIWCNVFRIEYNFAIIVRMPNQIKGEWEIRNNKNTKSKCRKIYSRNWFAFA